MADSMFHQPVMGRRAFVGGTLAASSMAFLAACGKKGGDASGSGSGSTLNFYINNPVCIEPYNVQEDQGTQVDSSTSSSIRASSSVWSWWQTASLAASATPRPSSS